MSAEAVFAVCLDHDVDDVVQARLPLRLNVVEHVNDDGVYDDCDDVDGAMMIMRMMMMMIKTIKTVILMWLRIIRPATLPELSRERTPPMLLREEMCFYCLSGVSENSRFRPFSRMKASDSLSRIMGMFFSFPSRSRNLGMLFFSFPFRSRILGMLFFSFPSCSRIMGMFFFHSLPVPKLWEWILLPIPEFAISLTGIKTGIGLL